MASPSLSKNWIRRGTTNNIKGTDALSNGQKVIFEISSALSDSGWTCSGSSNSSTSGMDGSNRWSTYTNLVWGTGAHSWIVRRQTAITSKFEICFDLVSSTTCSTITIVISPNNGFGTANGGTDGSTSARPTATDEIVVVNNATWADNIGSFYNTSGYYINAVCTDTLDCVRIFLTTSYTYATCAVMAFFIEKPQNPISSWTNPWIAGITSSLSPGSGVLKNQYDTYNHYNRYDKLFFKPTTTSPVGKLFMATTFTGTRGLFDAYYSISPNSNKISGNYTIYPIALISDTAGTNGVWGEVYDLYFTDNFAGHGDIPTDSSSFMFIDLMMFVMPSQVWR
jgi:hypothetical protein